jgi:hypothetical protein
MNRTFVFLHMFKNVHFHLFCCVFVLLSFFGCAQEKKDSILKELPPVYEYDSSNVLKINWKKVNDAVSICETYAPRRSAINDSKITILRLNPKHLEVELLMATEHYGKPLTAPEWADSFGMNIVINAGMYDLNRKMYSKGYLKDHNHVNKGERLPNYKSVIAFSPKDTADIPFTVCDLDCDSFASVQKRFYCMAQGLRMLDCNGGPIGWNKRKQYCSQLVCTIDDLGYIYLVFVRSPYLHNEMISYMRQLDLNLYNAIYLEGGPQTSLYVDIPLENDECFHIEKIGSYVSETYPNDKNNRFWKLPNVIGFKVK